MARQKLSKAPRGAFLVRAAGNGFHAQLREGPEGSLAWVLDERSGTRFGSEREAEAFVDRRLGWLGEGLFEVVGV